ncbi:MAG: DNA polymerase III subunit delta [Chitinophagaceae bacterium]|nr:DNA polymerase III subunit delta [Chitinophagaceae bacterium]
MSVEKIIADWKKKLFKPVYWLEGEEEYFINKLVEFAETRILPESEASFNLSVFYGKDANWADIINACRRYPMFAERQVVLLKEAQHMRDIDKLETYIDNPLSSTVFVVAYKDKKLDGRKKLVKIIKEKGELLTTKKLYDKQLPEWTRDILQSKGLTATAKGVALIVDHIGNDLSRIENEIDKLAVNLGQRKAITEEDIENYIGISKDYNVFELNTAMANRDLPKAIRIIGYFESNPKAAPIQMVLPSLYNFFSKVFMVYGSGSMDEKTVSAKIGIPPYFVGEYINAARLYTYAEVEQALLLLCQFNLKAVGVGDAGTEDASLLREMIAKMMARGMAVTGK